MSRLIPEPPREVVRKLRKLGFKGTYGGGKHPFMRHPVSKKKIPIPMHGKRDIKVGTIREIVKEVGIDIEDWIKL